MLLTVPPVTVTRPAKAPELEMEPASRSVFVATVPALVKAPPETLRVLPKATGEMVAPALLAKVPELSVTSPPKLPALVTVAPSRTAVALTMPALAKVVPACTLSELAAGRTPVAETSRVPAETVVEPVKVFTPPRIQRPVPVLRMEVAPVLSPMMRLTVLSPVFEPVRVSVRVPVSAL